MLPLIYYLYGETPSIKNLATRCGLRGEMLFNKPEIIPAANDPMTHPVHLWHGELADALDGLPDYWQLLDNSEKIHARQFKFPRQQSYYVQTHGILRILLAKATNTQPQALVIARSQHGKPYLPDYPELAFNLSHSGNYLAIALAENCQLGVDIEILKPRTNLVGLVNKCFARSEAEYWQSLPEQQKLSEFFRFWTTKEAFVKATGRGIALGLQQCIIDPAPCWHFSSLPEAYCPPATWKIQHVNINPNLSTAIVADKEILIFINNLIETI